jgi:hypothetical protein
MSEIEAMSAIDEALAGIGEDQQKRVLRWAVDKFGGGTITVGDERRSVQTGNGGGDAGGSGEYARISDLMDATSPTTIVDHVLVGSYWFQVVLGKDDFTGQEVNSELKDLGQASKNITESFTSLMKRKPPLARQVQKSGTSQQGRKKYRLTEPGIRAVQRMIRGETGE